MRTYDLVFILTPELGEDAATAAVEEYRKIIRDAGNTPDQDDHWGRRRLAYLIGRHREGIYHHFRLTCEPKLIAELERKMKYAENMVRYLAVRVDEDMKRQAKIDKKKKPRTGPPQMGPTSDRDFSGGSSDSLPPSEGA